MGILEFDTLTFASENGKMHNDLDLAKPLSHLKISLDATVTGSGSPAIVYNGRAGKVLDNISIGGGSDTVFEAEGMDLYDLMYTLNKKVPTHTAIGTGTTAQAVKLSGDIPVALNPGNISNPQFRIQWGTTLGLGTTLALTAATINGSYVHSEKPLENMKVLEIPATNKTTKWKAQLDASGKLSALFIKCWATATPYAEANGLTAIDLQIEGDIKIKGMLANELSEGWAQRIGGNVAVATGNYYIDLTDYNIVPGNQSYLKATSSGTAYDYHIYEIFERISGQPEVKQKTVTDTNQRKVAQVKSNGANQPIVRHFLGGR